MRLSRSRSAISASSLESAYQSNLGSNAVCSSSRTPPNGTSRLWRLLVIVCCTGVVTYVFLIVGTPMYWREEHQYIPSESVRKLTIVMNTFKRHTMLRDAIDYYSKCVLIDYIYVVWSEKQPPPQKLVDLMNRRELPKIIFNKEEVDSLNSRFKPLVGPHSDAIFSVDDDMRVPCEDLQLALEVWRGSPNNLIGFMPRIHLRQDGKLIYRCWWRVWWHGVYSIILTKAAILNHRFFHEYTSVMPSSIRSLVDQKRNCEDIAMQFMISNLTKLAPIYVKGHLWDIGSLGGISTSKNIIAAKHMNSRSDCLNDLEQLFGKLPLVTSHFIVDSAANGWTNVPSTWGEFISSDLWNICGNNRGNIPYLENNLEEKRDGIDGQLNHVIHEGSILSIIHDYEGLNLYSCSDDKTICRITKKSLLGQKDENLDLTYFQGHKKAVNRMAIDSKYIWSISRDLSLIQWNSMSGEMIGQTEHIHTLNVSAVAINKSNSSTVFTGSRDYHVKGWDVETMKPIVEFSSPRNIVTVMQIDPTNPNLLYQGSEDLCVRVWDIRNSSTQPASQITGYTYFPLCMDIHGDGNLLSTGSKGFNYVGCEVKLWDLRQIKQPYSEFHGHGQDVTGCKFVKKNKNALISASKDGSIFAWNSETSDQQPVASCQTSGRNITSITVDDIPYGNHLDLPVVNSESESKQGESTHFTVATFDGSLIFLSLVMNKDDSEIGMDYLTKPFISNNDTTDAYALEKRSDQVNGESFAI